MGLFGSRKPFVPVEGVIARIGITYFSDVTHTYTLLLEDGQSWEIDSGIGAAARARVNPEIAMAKPGDRVRFEAREGTSFDVRGFRNLTMRPDPTSL